MASRPSLYEHILDAAEEIVLESGAAHLTFDAIAKRVGISKGGLLYHFASKEALLKAMIRRLVNCVDEERIVHCPEFPANESQEMKAHIVSSLDMSSKFYRLFVSLLAVVAHNPKLLDSVKDEFQRLLSLYHQKDYSTSAWPSLSLLWMG